MVRRADQDTHALSRKEKRTARGSGVAANSSGPPRAEGWTDESEMGASARPVMLLRLSSLVFMAWAD